MPERDGKNVGVGWYLWVRIDMAKLEYDTVSSY